MQLVLPGEADRAVNLMGDRRRRPDRAIRAQFGGGDFKTGVTAIGGATRGQGGAIDRCRFVRKQRQRVLDRLEFADRLAKLDALVRILNGLAQYGVQRAGNLRSPGKRTDRKQIFCRRTGADDSNIVEAEIGERFTRDSVAPVRDRGIGSCDQCDLRVASVAARDDEVASRIPERHACGVAM